MRAAIEKLADVDGDDIGELLKAVGMALVSKVGGAAGPLYGTLFLRMGAATAGKTELDLGELDGGGRGRAQRRPAARQRRARRQDDGRRAAARASRRCARTPDGATRGALRESADAAARACWQRSRWRRAKAAPAISVRAAWTIRTQARRRRELLLRAAAERFT